MQRQEAARSHRLVHGEEQRLPSVAFLAGHTPRLHPGLAGHELQVCAAALLSVLPSGWKLDALLGSALVIALGAAMAVIYTRLTSADARWAISGAASGLIASATLAALQVRGGGQAATFTYHPNIAAGFFLVGAFGMLGAAAGLRLSSGAWARALQALCFVAFVASLAGLAFTGSRSSVIGFLAGAVVLVPFLIARAWQRLRGWSMLAFLGVAGGLVALAYFGLFPAAPGANLVVNSGFEAGTYPWKLGGGSARASTAEPLALARPSTSSVRLPGYEPIWVHSRRASWRYTTLCPRPVVASACGTSASSSPR